MKYFLLAWAISFSTLLMSQQKNTTKEDFKLFPEIFIKPAEGVINISRDTIELKVAENLSPDAIKAEDVFRQLMGFHVTEEGKIFYNGREIFRLLIDGDPIEAYDYRTIAKSIHANALQSVQVILHYHPNRFSNLGALSNEVAINVKLKKEYLRKLNTDPLLGITDKKALYGNLDMVRLASRLKSFVSVDFNNRAYTKDKNIEWLSKEEREMNFIGKPGVSSTAPAFAFKRIYLPNNTSFHYNQLHVFKIHSFHTIHVESNADRLKESNHRQLNTFYQLENDNTLAERSSSHYNSKEVQQSLRFSYVHDRFKKNRGEYHFLINIRNGIGSLNDTISRLNRWLNAAKAIDLQHSFVFSGKEQVLIGKKYVMEFQVQGGKNYADRTLNTYRGETNQITLLQQVISSDLGLSRTYKRIHSTIGVRIFSEQRSKLFSLQKKYLYTSFLYKRNKKFQVQQDLSLGKGEWGLKNQETPNPIYLLEGRCVYDPSFLNQFYFSWLFSQRMLYLDWLVEQEIEYLNGNKQYFKLTNAFQRMNRIELGRSRNNVYKGFQYGYTIAYTQTDRDLLHSLQIAAYSISDTIRIDKPSQTLQCNGHFDQRLFALNMNLSLSQQFSYSQFIVSMNGQQQTMQMRTALFKIGCRSSWKIPFQFEWVESVQCSTLASVFRSTTTRSLQSNLYLKWIIASKSSIGLQISQFKNEKLGSTSFVDFLIQSKATTRVHLNLTCLNLLNRKFIYQLYTTTYGYQEQISFLGGRKIMLGLRWVI